MLELVGWRGLLAGALARLRRQASVYWLHTVAVVLEPGSPREEVVRSLVRFLEAATLADFSSRLETLGSVARLLEATGHRRQALRAALHNLAIYYGGLRPGVERALADRLRQAEAKVKEFTKVARWKDTSFWSVKAIVEKSRKMLHKTMREYEKAVSVPAKGFFVEGELGSGEEEPVLAVGRQLVVRQDVVVNGRDGGPVGSLGYLARRAARHARSLGAKLAGLEVVSEVADLLPRLVEEMGDAEGPGAGP